VARSSPPSSGPGSFYAAGGAPWADKVINNENGNPKAILFNAVVALTHDPEFTDINTGEHSIRHDAFRARTMLCGPVPWDKHPNVPRPWTDQDDREATAWLQDNNIMVGQLVTGSAVQLIAERNRYHPVMDYLSSLVWDGMPRLDTWLSVYIRATDNEYSQAVGSRWMISGVARIFEPGCQADCVLVLEGPQGIKKTTTFNVLGGPFYSNDIAALGTKDAQEQILGKWIVELDELEAVTRAADVAAVRAFVSRRIDDFRLPYGRRSQAYPRQCIFGGTTNRDTWMRDETGGRRWWPVRCGEIDIDALRQDRDQLWAEARDRYLTGDAHWLDTPRLVSAAGEEQEARFEQDPWEEIIEDHLDGLKETSTNSLLQAVGVPTERRSTVEWKRIAAIMRRRSWERKQVGTGPSRSWKYVPKV
jgi:predicted P-loop ATPase